MAGTERAEQCNAITADGTRCSLPAQEDGFCHQHDESDRTVDERSTHGETENTAGDGTDTAADGAASADATAEDDAAAASRPDDASSPDDASRTDDGGEPDAGAGAGGDAEADDGVGSILEVRETVHAVAERLIGQELDGVVEITQNGDDWLATVEVVERHAVPNTQDILGKYEVVLDTTGTVTGYRRLDTYRRGDTSQGDITP